MTSIAGATSPKTYKYSVEISQMCYVFEKGYVNPPEEVVHYIEDIVRSQLIEIVSLPYPVFFESFCALFKLTKKQKNLIFQPGIAS